MLLLGEVALRVIGLGHPYYSAPELYRASDDPRVLFEPRPELRRLQRGRLAHDEQSRPARARAAAGEARWHPARGLPGRLCHLRGRRQGRGAIPAPAGEHRQRQRRHGPIETVNTGVVGYNTVQELARLEQAGIAYQPDVVVLTFVVNDLLETFSIFDHQYEPTGMLAGPKVWLRRNSHLYRFVQQMYWRLGPGAAPGARGAHRAAPQARARGRAAGDPRRDRPRDPGERRTLPARPLSRQPERPGQPGAIRRAPDDAGGAGAVRRARAGATVRPDGCARRRPRPASPPVPAARGPPPEPGRPPRDRRRAAGAADSTCSAGDEAPPPTPSPLRWRGGRTTGPLAPPLRAGEGGWRGEVRGSHSRYSGDCRRLRRLRRRGAGAVRFRDHPRRAADRRCRPVLPDGRVADLPGAPAVYLPRPDTRAGRPVARRPGRRLHPGDAPGVAARRDGALRLPAGGTVWSRRPRWPVRSSSRSLAARSGC